MAARIDNLTRLSGNPLQHGAALNGNVCPTGATTIEIDAVTARTCSDPLDPWIDDPKIRVLVADRQHRDARVRRKWHRSNGDEILEREIVVICAVGLSAQYGEVANARVLRLSKMAATQRDCRRSMARGVVTDHILDRQVLHRIVARGLAIDLGVLYAANETATDPDPRIAALHGYARTRPGAWIVVDPLHAAIGGDHVLGGGGPGHANVASGRFQVDCHSGHRIDCARCKLE